MRYKYSICYPDKDQIDFPYETIGNEEVIQLVKKFDWDKELNKELVFYAPSLDFINISNKKRMILSGIGKGKLEKFQVMYVLPNNDNVIKAFDNSNYYNSEEYYGNFSINISLQILYEF